MTRSSYLRRCALRAALRCAACVLGAAVAAAAAGGCGPEAEPVAPVVKPLPVDAQVVQVPAADDTASLPASLSFHSLQAPLSAAGSTHAGLLSPAQPGDHPAAPGSGDVASGVRSDYTIKADVYWKLNWVRLELLDGPLPPNLSIAIARTRRELDTAQRDQNYQLAADALRHLDSGLKHLRSYLATEGTADAASDVPWSSGVLGVTRFEVENRLIPGERPPARSDGPAWPSDDLLDGANAPRLPAPESEPTGKLHAAAVALEYARRYRASPESMMRSEWEAAIRDIDRLRDSLGLAGRRENADGDRSALPIGLGHGWVEAPATLAGDDDPFSGASSTGAASYSPP